MKKHLAAVLIFGLALISTPAFAQHSDVEFGYDDLVTPTTFEIEQDNVTSDGIQFFEAEFEELDPFDPGNFSSDEPGFATNDAEALLINPNDQIWINVLDGSISSAFGVGYVNYYNPTSGLLESSGRIAVQDNSGGTADLVLNGGSIESGPNPQFLGLGDIDGDLHDHVVFDLLDDATAPLGAYGLLIQLQSDFDVADGNMDISSDPFWVIWNHGLSEEEFENDALAAFGVTSIPEPSSLAILFGGAVAFMVRRRRS